MNTKIEPVVPFSNGTEYMRFLEQNCYNGCARYEEFHEDLQSDDPRCCPIEGALTTGEISPELYKLMGEGSARCAHFQTPEQKRAGKE